MTGQEIGVLIMTAGLSILVWHGAYKPGRLFGGPALPSAPPRSDTSLAEHIAELECDTRMCEHAVGEEHPEKVWTSKGKVFWRLSDGRMWEEGTPCPYR